MIVSNSFFLRKSVIWWKWPLERRRTREIVETLLTIIICVYFCFDLFCILFEIQRLCYDIVTDLAGTTHSIGRDFRGALWMQELHRSFD